MRNNPRIGIIGLGGRGYGLLNGELLKFKDITITACCDNYQDRADDAAKAVKSKHGNIPYVTTDYKELLTRDDIDIIMITCAWEDHIKVAIEAMNAGKYVAMEVGGAYNVQDCWDLVDCYEKTGVPVMFLENCCYGQYELMALNMVRSGVFGEIVHCSGGYMHDLRLEIADGVKNRHYRLRNYLERNCENYPTHELGPIAKILNINRGNIMVSLNSMSSNAAGLRDYLESRSKYSDSPLRKEKFAQGDIVTTTIKCHNGETIVLTLDTTLPRAYSRGFTVRGTKGSYCEDGNAVFLDKPIHLMQHGNPKFFWNNGKKFVKKYNHPLWKNAAKLKRQGHGGMDTLVLRAMVESYKNNTLPPIDVYDTASWMVITALSEMSIKNNSNTVDIPDFTRGKWKNRTDKSSGIYCLD